MLRVRRVRGAPDLYGRATYPARPASVFGWALLAWLAAFELLAGAQGWWGLSLLGKGRVQRLLAPVPLLALLRMRQRPGRAALALALMFAPALALHLAGSNLRHWRLDPKRRLDPGSYADRRIERVEIAVAKLGGTQQGYVPGLHIIPGGTDAPQGQPRLAVCVAHGSGCDKTYYSWRLVDALVARGIAVLLVDLDGHGENPRPQSFPGMLDSVAAPVQWLRQRYKRVALVGFSLGACLAARAVADGLRVDALALLEGPPRLVFGQREVRKEALLLARPSAWHPTSDSSLYYIVRAWRTAPIRATISTWDLIEALDLVGSVKRISVPLLLVYAGRDAIVPRSQAAQVRAAMPAQAHWHWVARASHLSLILEPEMLALVGDWLADLARG